MALRHGVRGIRVAAGRLAGPGRAALATGAPRGGGRAAGGSSRLWRGLTGDGRPRRLGRRPALAVHGVHSLGARAPRV